MERPRQAAPPRSPWRPPRLTRLAVSTARRHLDFLYADFTSDGDPTNDYCSVHHHDSGESQCQSYR
jgi:hypothetical protein